MVDPGGIIMKRLIWFFRRRRSETIDTRYNQLLIRIEILEKRVKYLESRVKRLEDKLDRVFEVG